MRLEMFNQRRAPCLTRFRIAQCIKLQRHPFGNAQLPQKLVGEHQQFNVCGWPARTYDFSIDLMELAISPLLRAFIAKDRAGGCDLERCELLPTLSEISPRDPRRELRPQGQAVAAPIGKGVHFLRNNVSRFAQRARSEEHTSELQSLMRISY